VNRQAALVISLSHLPLVTYHSMSSKQHPGTTTNSSNATITTPSNNLFKAAATLVAIVAVILAFYNPLKNAFLRQLPKHQTAAISNTTATTTRAMATSAAPFKIHKRPWNARGHADHGTSLNSPPIPSPTRTNT